MATPVFTWTPSWGTTERSAPRTRNAELAQAAALGSDGTSADLKTWSVALENRLHDEALAIDLFLASRGGVEVFEWDNPRSLIKLYVCEQWECVVVADRGRGDVATDRIWTVNATFREVALAGAGGTVRPPTPSGPTTPLGGVWFQYTTLANRSFDGTPLYVTDTDDNLTGYVVIGNYGNFSYTEKLGVAKMDLRNATPYWAKQYSRDDKGVFPERSTTDGTAIIDDGAGTGTISLFFMRKASASQNYRIYRIEINKADGSVANTYTIEFNGPDLSSMPTNLAPSVYKHPTESKYFIMFFGGGIADASANPPFPSSNSAGTIWALFNADMTPVWMRQAGKQTIDAQRLYHNPNTTSFSASMSGGVGGLQRMEVVNGDFVWASDVQGGQHPLYWKMDPATGLTTGGTGFWSRTFGTDNNSVSWLRGSGPAFDPDDNKYVVVSDNSANASPDLVIVKLDANDDVVWSHQFACGKMATSAPHLRQSAKMHFAKVNGVDRILLTGSGEHDGVGASVYFVAFDKDTGQLVAGTDRAINGNQTVPETLVTSEVFNNGRSLMLATYECNYIRIDLNDIPAIGSYPYVDVGGSWDVDDLQPSVTPITIYKIAYTEGLKTWAGFGGSCNAGVITGDPTMPLTFNWDAGSVYSNPAVTYTVSDAEGTVKHVGGYYDYVATP